MSQNHSTTGALDALESAIANAGLRYYLVPMADEFQGEYTPPHAARLPRVTGFAGSAGLGVFATAGGPHALLVDGRYVLQAPQQVDTARIRVINSGEVSLGEWLVSQQAAGKIGFDPWLVTPQQLARWKKATQNLALEWVATPNLIDADWADRPAFPASAVRLEPLTQAGVSYREKRATLLEKMAQAKADGWLCSSADSINWLLNIRASDIEFNPLVLGYFLLSADGSAVFYTYPRAWDAAVAEYLADNQVRVADIAEVFSGKAGIWPTGARVMLDEAQAAQGWSLLAEKNGWISIAADDLTALPKAIKNGAELAAIREAHQRDGLALTRFFAWLDAQVLAGRVPDELSVVEQLEEFRAADAAYAGPSFATIAGSGPNGAIVHYRADTASNRKLQRGELLLLDSGGQYPGGTTDVTRTVYLPISAKEGAAGLANATPAHLVVKDRYTRVLKGHIALATARFPAGTTGAQLDALARQFLWQVGLDYDHGTGHGVGAGLCVHEGPQRIGKRGSEVALKPGMILSNEPGYYEAGSYGIRIENLVEVVALGEVQGRAQFGFETLTLAPIDTRLVEIRLLTADERNWLNSYHRRVFGSQEAQLDAATRSWLLAATRAI